MNKTDLASACKELNIQELKYLFNKRFSNYN